MLCSVIIVAVVDATDCRQLGFSTHRKKRMRQLKRQKKSGLASAGTGSDDPFELFVNSTNIRYRVRVAYDILYENIIFFKKKKKSLGSFVSTYQGEGFGNFFFFFQTYAQNIF